MKTALNLKTALKRFVSLLAALLVLPAACLACFGRFHEGFVFFANLLAFVPGMIGSYFRVAYYSLTLEGGCGNDCHIAIGSYFSQRDAALGNSVGIGAYCVLGKVRIGDRTLIASGVQALSGATQHIRNSEGRLTDEGRMFRLIKVGADCWIGAASVIMANLGENVTVAAGSVVSRDVPARATVAGNPARIVRVAEMVEAG